MPFTAPFVLPAGTLAQTPQPVLATDDGLLLRPWRTSDAPAVHTVFQDPLMHQWHIRAADSEEEVLGWIADWQRGWGTEKDAQWAVVDQDTGLLLGRVALRNIALSEGTADVAYWTSGTARGRGVASRATTELTRWAFGEIGFHRLELSHAVANEASCRVAVKSGFTLEGTRRSAALHQDGWHDMHLHARVRGD